MTFRAGERNKLVIIQRATTAKDAYGEQIESWAEIGREWAAILNGRGNERRQAAMEQGAQPATFHMLSNTLTRDLRLTDRLIAQGVVWDIRGVVFDNPMPGNVEVVAVANPEIAP